VENPNEGLVVDPDVIEAIANVRRDNSDTKWILAGYERGSSTHVVLYGSGNDDGVDELKSLLDDELVLYGLVRKIERIDNSNTVKFCYIKWTGPNIPRMVRARHGIYIGDINQIFHPYHCDLPCETQTEISDDMIVTLIAKTSGQHVNVLDNVSEKATNYYGTTSSYSTTSKTNVNVSGEPPAPKTTTNYNRTKPATTTQNKPPPSNENQQKIVECENETEVRELIQSVRNDNDPTEWCLVTYSGPRSNILVTLGSGTGGAEAMAAQCQDDIVCYGLIRKTEQIDNSTTVKFAFITWKGPNIPVMQKAKLGTHSGVVAEIFHPYHVTLTCEDRSEISDQIIEDAISTASGRKNHVR